MYSISLYVLILLVCICTASRSVTAVGITTCGPTPQDLETQFSNNCANLQLPMQKCEVAWQRFVEGFAGRNPSDVQPRDYQPYFMELPIEVGTDETLFWSGVPELVSMVNMMSEMGSILSSKNIPASAIIDRLTNNICWCGDPEGGIEFNNPCDNCIPVTSFWEEFSIQFALAAKGTVFWLAWGENPDGTYRDSSFFAMHEIPNLSTSDVNELVILVVHRRGQGEACGEGTLQTLQNVLIGRGFSYTCYNIYGDPWPMDEQQLSTLTDCAVHIITAEQEGTNPAPLPCFSTAMCLEFSWMVLVLGYIHVLVSSQIL